MFFWTVNELTNLMMGVESRQLILHMLRRISISQERAMERLYLFGVGNREEGTRESDVE